jgi:enterochelin esterase-like enzyme
VTDITPDVLPLTKDADGLWTVTTAALSPAMYAYAFSVDGVDQPDPRNSWVKTNLVSQASLVLVSGVLVPGAPAKPWEPAAIPHGTVHSHVYTTAAVEGLPANQSRYVVYTPPGYDADAEWRYPVLYLLHGWSDLETSWTHIGQAHHILDALMAAGEAKPMVVVMPLGYGQMSFVESGVGALNDPAAVLANAVHFERALLNEILTQVESSYHVRRDREGRAIAGQSMGGLESLLIGLNHADMFAWIGGFSSAVGWLDGPGASELLRGPSSSAVGPRLVWLTCGREDPFLAANRRVIAWLEQQGVSIAAGETAGGHTWPVWREDLVRFVPLLFGATG